MAAECVVKNAAKSAGEGPHWDDVTDTLLYVDSVEKSIHRYQPGTETDECFHTEDIVTFVVPARRGGFIAAVGCCLVHLDWDTKKVTKLQESDQKLQFNDGKCDPKGRVWAGTVGPMATDLENMPKIGSLYRLDLDGSLHAMVRNIGISNGLAWSSDEKFMFYIDSIPRKVYRYDFDTSTGNISNQRVVVDMEGKSVEDYGYPDGMTIDAEDKLWVACFFAGKVARYDPNTGQRLQCIDIPLVPRVTSCCFGGKGLDELYVTTSAYGTDKAISSEEFEKYPLSGSLFRVIGLGVKGRKARIFEGKIDHLKM